MPHSRQPPKPWRRLTREAAGFSLIELLVAMTMFGVVLLAVFTIYDTATRDASAEAERGEAITEDSTGLASMVQELDVMARLPGSGDTRLFFNCAYSDPTSGYKDCVRYASPASTAFTAGTAPTGVTGTIVVQRVANNTTADPSDPVFTNLSAPSGSGSQPTFGDAMIKSPSSGSLTASASAYTHLVTLTDAFYMANLDFGR